MQKNNKNKNSPLVEKENLSARFSLCTPKGLSVEEKQHMQEVRWDVRKPFSGSICQAREGKGVRQTARARVREGEGEGERHPEPMGEGSLRGTACAFQEYCYTSQPVLVGTSSSAAFSTRLRGSGVWGEVSEACGWCHWCLPEATAAFNIWSLTSPFSPQ